MTAGIFFPVGKGNPFFPVGGINLNRLGRYVQTQRETILSHFVLGIDFHHCGPVTEAFMSPVWVSNLFKSQFCTVGKRQWEFRPKPLILILENCIKESKLTVSPSVTKLRFDHFAFQKQLLPCSFYITKPCNHFATLQQWNMGIQRPRKCYFWSLCVSSLTMLVCVYLRTIFSRLLSTGWLKQVAV